MKKTILILAVITLALLMGLGAWGSPLKVSLVPADAAWMFHVDVEKLVSSGMFKLFQDKGAGAKIQHGPGQFFNRLRIDPLKDLKAITIFSRGKNNEEPVVAISGRLDMPYLLGLLKAESTTKEIPYGKLIIYSWDGDHFGVFAADNLALIAQREENIKWALDALAGTIENISKSPLLSRLLKESPGAFFQAAVINLSEMVCKEEKPAILSKMRHAACSITEVREMISLKLDIAAESAQVAKEMEQAIRGLIAIVNLQFADSDAQTFTQSINISVDGENVRIDAAYPTLKLLEFLKKRGGFPHLSLDNLNPLSYY